MDKLIEQAEIARTFYKGKKEESDCAYEEVKAIEVKIIELLTAAGKDRYIGKNMQVSISHDMSVQTPKTPEDKKAMFQWIAANLGQDVADNYVTINSVSLNSLYKELTDEYSAKGEVLMIDGLGEPIARTKLSMRKA